jgi:hypothetical protein
MALLRYEGTLFTSFPEVVLALPGVGLLLIGVIGPVTCSWWSCAMLWPSECDATHQSCGEGCLERHWGVCWSGRPPSLVRAYIRRDSLSLVHDDFFLLPLPSASISFFARFINLPQFIPSLPLGFRRVKHITKQRCLLPLLQLILATSTAVVLVLVLLVVSEVFSVQSSSLLRLHVHPY